MNPTRFLSTPSARRATAHSGDLARPDHISIHALREEGDSCQQLFLLSAFNFYPRPPRGGRRRGYIEGSLKTVISIHALREEGDRSGRGCPWRRSGDFYPRPPRGGRHRHRRGGHLRLRFLSTPSARRATHALLCLHAAGEFLSTPSARRATRHETLKPHRKAISIHALREEGDKLSPNHSGKRTKFLSTPSARRATKVPLPDLRGQEISIHALREEGDV